MGIKNWIKGASAAAIVSLAFGGTALADQIVVPGSCGAGPCATTEGNYYNNIPFHLYTLSASYFIDYQQVYASSEFAAIGSKMSITQIAFRPNQAAPIAVAGKGFSATLGNVVIELSTTAKNPGGLSTILTENYGGDRTLVYSGPLPLSSNATGPSTGPRDFDIVIDLQTPFVYDPAAGNLLLFVQNRGGIATTMFDAVQYATATSRVYYNSSDSTIPIDTQNKGLVARFTVTPVPSEPPPPSGTQVSAAVKPGGKAQINPKSQGTTPVAIFGTASFDAGTVDPKSVKLNGAPVKLKPNGSAMADLKDIDGDGLRDLLIHIDTQALVSGAGGSSLGAGVKALSAAAPGSGTAEAVLEGKTYDGTPIQGTVSFQVVK